MGKVKEEIILLSGATGMIGSFLIDVIMYKNLNEGLCCHIYAVGRNEEKREIVLRNIGRMIYLILCSMT